METETPRRMRMDLRFAPETKIYEAMNSIEEMPADVRLTDAVQLLSQAAEKVADFIDSEEGKSWLISKAVSV